MHFKLVFLLCVPAYWDGIQVVSFKRADSLTDFNYLAQQDSLQSCTPQCQHLTRERKTTAEEDGSHCGAKLSLETFMYLHIERFWAHRSHSEAKL